MDKNLQVNWYTKYKAQICTSFKHSSAVKPHFLSRDGPGFQISGSYKAKILKIQELLFGS